MTSTTKFFAATAICLAASMVAPWQASAAEWGNLTGKFLLEGATPSVEKIPVTKDQATCGKCNLVNESLIVGADGGIANVVIYVITKKVAVNPEYEASAAARVELDNKCCRFQPHISLIRLGQTLVMKNSDDVGHNTNLQPLGDAGVNPLIPAGGEQEYKFNRVQTRPVPVGCNIHPWMRGYILPRDNPYMAISAADGSFTIANLPAGKLEFQVWHEIPGYLDLPPKWKKGKFELTIKAGDNSLGDVKVPVKLFAAK